jgi:FkbM family methyltransferase
MYSIYAAVMTGCQVVSVEPESLNFAELNKNVFLNGLHGRVTPICAAATDQRKIDRLNLGTFGIGYAFHDFGENTWKSDQKWTPEVTTRRDQRVQQGCMGVTIDELVSSGFMRAPDHIKIDVDGLEHRVIAGAHDTLRDPRLKTVLIELDHAIDHSHDIFDMMTGLGWKYSEDQLITNRNNIMKKERVRELRQLRKDGFNYIFFRDDRYHDLFANFLAGYTPPYNDQNRMTHPPKLVDTTRKA